MKTYKITMQSGMCRKSFTLKATDRSRAYDKADAIIDDRWVITDITDTSELWKLNIYL